MTPLKERYRATPAAAQETGAAAGDVAALLQATERYCVVFQTLAAGPAITMSLS